MGQLNFFAVREDHRQVIEFLFDETDFRIFKLYSEFGRELREFKSFRDLLDVFDVGNDPHGYGCAALLSLWSPSVMRTPHIVRVKLDPEKCQGFTFRFAASGWGTVQLHLGGVHEKIVTKSDFGHFSERGARSRGYRSGVDWAALSKLSNRLRYHVSKRLAVAHVPGHPVLPGAYELHRAGYELKDSAGSWTSYVVPEEE